MASLVPSKEDLSNLARAMSGIVEAMPPTSSDTSSPSNPTPDTAAVASTYVPTDTRPNTPTPSENSSNADSRAVSPVPTEIVPYDPRTDQEIAVDTCRELNIKIKDFGYDYILPSKRVPIPFNPVNALSCLQQYLESDREKPLSGETLFRLLEMGPDWLTEEDEAQWDDKLRANLKEYKEMDEDLRRAWYPRPRHRPAEVKAVDNSLAGAVLKGKKRQADFDSTPTDASSLDADQESQPPVPNPATTPPLSRPRKRQRTMSPARSDDNLESFGVPQFLLREPRVEISSSLTYVSSSSNIAQPVERTASAMSLCEVEY